MNVDKSSGPAWLVPGCALDRYDLLLPIAEGGMAKLWLARQQGKHGFDKVVAIKTILPRLASEPGFREMFLDEARLASRVEHVNVAQVLDLGEEAGVLFLVMEWVDGEALINVGRAVSRKSGPLPMPVGVLARIAADGCAGLQAAHELCDPDGTPLNVVHRDVSPHNLLVGFHGTTKVIDFGIAKARNRVTSKTSDGVVKGKVAYMAPEQAMGLEVDRRTDVWGVGATMYRFLADRTPFSAANKMATLRLLLSGQAAPRLPTTVPDGIRRVVHRSLELNPADRFQSAEEMQLALEEAMRTDGCVTTHADVNAFMNHHFGLARADRMRSVELAMRESRSRTSPVAGMYASGVDVAARPITLTSGQMRASLPGGSFSLSGSSSSASGSSSSAARAASALSRPSDITNMVDSADLLGSEAVNSQRLLPITRATGSFHTPSDGTSMPAVLAPIGYAVSTVPPTLPSDERHPLEFRISQFPAPESQESFHSDGVVPAAGDWSGPQHVQVHAPPSRLAGWRRAAAASSAIVAMATLVAFFGWTRTRPPVHAGPAKVWATADPRSAAPVRTASETAPVSEVEPVQAQPLPAPSAQPTAAAPAASNESAPVPLSALPTNMLIERARKAQTAGHGAEALSLLKMIVGRQPNDSESLTRLADAERTQGMTAEAIADYQRAVAANGRYFPSRLALADLTWDMGQQGAAKTMYKAIIDTFPQGLCPDRARERARDSE